MAANIFTTLFRLSPKLKGVLWRQGYQFLSEFYQERDWKFINYGYAPISDTIGPSETVVLDPADEDNRFCIQLYQHLAEPVDLKGLRVLEVGSGRGGGADYINRYLAPETMVGIDFSKNAVAFCKRTYCANGLSFTTGNAESIPFASNSFDAIICVESSHCYHCMDTFLGEVKRILRKGGWLLFADFRAKESINTLREQINRSGLVLVRDTDITANVFKALNQDNDRKTALVKCKTSELLGLDKAGHQKLRRIKSVISTHMVRWLCEFLGTRNSRIYKKFQGRDAVYMSFILQKQTD